MGHLETDLTGVFLIRPKFTRPFVLSFNWPNRFLVFLGVWRFVLHQVYDEDLQFLKGLIDHTDLSHHEMQGDAWFSIKELMEAPNRTITKVWA